MKEITVSGSEDVAALAELLAVSPADLIGAGFKDLGLMLTIYDSLSFEQIEELAASFGFRVRRRDPSG